MGLQKNYLKVGHKASNQLFGIPRVTRGSTPLSMLISYGAKFNSSKLNVNLNKLCLCLLARSYGHSCKCYKPFYSQPLLASHLTLVNDIRRTRDIV